MTTEPSKSTCQARGSKTHFFTSSGALTPSLRSVARPPLLVKTWTKNTRSTPTFCCTRSFAALTRSLAKSESKASAFPPEELRSSVLSFASLTRTPFARGTIAGALRHHTATTPQPYHTLPNRLPPSLRSLSHPPSELCSDEPALAAHGSLRSPFAARRDQRERLAPFAQTSHDVARRRSGGSARHRTANHMADTTTPFQDCQVTDEPLAVRRCRRKIGNRTKSRRGSLREGEAS